MVENFSYYFIDVFVENFCCVGYGFIFFELEVLGVEVEVVVVELVDFDFKGNFCFC